MLALVLSLSTTIGFSAAALADTLDSSVSTSERPKLGLALGGGGTRGAAHIGVLRVLEQEGVKPDIIVGNSMGSIVGSLYCAGVPLEKIEELVIDGRLRKAYQPRSIPLQLLKKAGGKMINPFGKKKMPGFYDGQGLADFIDENVPEDKKLIENLSPRFAAVVTNLLDGKAYRLTQGNLGQAVRASATLPPILRAVEIDGNLYADGGIRSNMPTYPTRAMGADLVIAVDVNEPLKKLKPRDLMTMGKTANRMTSILLAVADELHLRIADVVINPKVSGIGLLSRDKEDFHKAVLEGEKAAHLAIPEIKRQMANFGLAAAKPERQSISQKPVPAETQKEEN
jgi:NTE family protein